MKQKASIGAPKRKSVIHEPKDATKPAKFFAKKKDEYQEIRIVLTKKKYANPQPVSATEAVIETIRHNHIDTRTKSLNQQKYLMLFQKGKTEATGRPRI